MEDRSATYGKALEGLDPDTLVKAILDQSRLIEELQKHIAQLEERIVELERASKRQAAPFRVEEARKKREKKRPGAKKGHQGHYRKPSGPVDASEQVPLACCPKCQGEVERLRPVKQVVEELVVRPYRLELTPYTGRCPRCGPVHSTHPLQSSWAQGSAGCHLGRQATATALLLNHRYGMSKRKVAELFTHHFGLPLSIGGFVQLQHRVAASLEAEYEGLGQQARRSPALYVDETSWYVAAPDHWLWSFSGADFTYYRVEGTRGRRVVEQVLGQEYEGVLVSDCLSVYDGVCPSQQKCFAHHLKAIGQALEKEPGSQYLREWKELLQGAIGWGRQKGKLPAQAYQAGCADLALEAVRLLRAPRASPWERSVGNRLEKQRGHLFTFLLKDGVEPTNNRAERSLRPAVIHRKVCCGNKTRKGADTWQVLASVITTAKQQRVPFTEKVGAAFNQSLQR